MRRGIIAAYTIKKEGYKGYIMKNLCHLLAAALLVFAAETAKAEPMLTTWGEKVLADNPSVKDVETLVRLALASR